MNIKKFDEEYFNWICIVWKEYGRSFYSLSDDYVKNKDNSYSELQKDLLEGKILMISVGSKQLKYKKIEKYSNDNLRKIIKRVMRRE